ncbi:MAG TPA: cytochrome c oxidase accessory protein CcoG [Rhodobacteraceae bacterium]|nr:cytochrome c oxidase accessory protein CcoG [Paracoccaceae bacterium]
MSTTEETPKLYAAREPVFPRKVKGKFRTLKWWLMIVTLGIYYITPWIRWDRGPNLPDQAVLIDLAGRRFYFFMIEIWPYEFYFIAGLLIMAGLGLFLFTSAAGRVWCGYACPQTIWTDLFILTERWVEGDRNARVRLWKAKWDARKWRLRLTKWFIWLLIGVATGGAWVFYFADAPTLLKNLVTGQAHPIAYITIAIMTATTVGFGGFAREQICIYMCPWPRIQAAMMDEDTLTVGYRSWRGEPRGKRRKGADVEGLGDCIDCNACVNVCPMGIDIRDGQQLECITCALCIDACDDVMEKIGKPRGLIDYLAASDEPLERAGAEPRPIWRHVFRPRTMMYITLWSLVGLGLLVALIIRPDIAMTVAPVRNPTYVTLSDGSVRNTYDVRFRNKHGDDDIFALAVEGAPDLQVSFEGAEGTSVSVPANETLLQRVYVIAPKGSEPAKSDRTEFDFVVTDQVGGETVTTGTVFNGKAQ